MEPIRHTSRHLVVSFPDYFSTQGISGAQNSLISHTQLSTNIHNTQLRDSISYLWCVVCTLANGKLTVPCLLWGKCLVLSDCPPSTLYKSSENTLTPWNTWYIQHLMVHTDLDQPMVFLAPLFQGSGQITRPSFFSPVTSYHDHINVQFHQIKHNLRINQNQRVKTTCKVMYSHLLHTILGSIVNHRSVFAMT